MPPGRPATPAPELCVLGLAGDCGGVGCARAGSAKPHALLNPGLRQASAGASLGLSRSAVPAHSIPQYLGRIVAANRRALPAAGGGSAALTHERGCEAELTDQQELILAAGKRPDLDALQAEFAPASSCLPHVTVALPSAVAYDVLLSNHAVEASA